MKRAKLALDGPLVRFVESFCCCRIYGLASPLRCDSREHFGRGFVLLFPCVGIDKSTVAPGGETVHGTSVEHFQARLLRRSVNSEARSSLLWREPYREHVQLGRPLQPIVFRDVGEVPIHHHNAGPKPHAE